MAISELDKQQQEDALAVKKMRQQMIQQETPVLLDITTSHAQTKGNS